MKKSAKSKKNEKVKDKQKEKEKEKEKEQKQEESEEFYTEEELKRLDKFHEFSEKKFSDDEIYEVMLKFNNDEELIKNELKEMLKILSKGDEFNWTEIGKSKKIFFYINYLKF